MNWKTLLVITSLSLSAGLTACNTPTPDATKTDTATPAAGEAPKGDAMKPAEVKGDKKPEAPKKP